MTLKEGLDEYLSANPGLTRFEPGDPDAELFFAHDACHVVFGLGTSVVEEAMIDYWTLLGTDLSLSNYLSYAKQIGNIDFGHILRTLGYTVFVREMLASAPYFLRVRKQAKRMQKRWPFHGFSEKLSEPLSSIRSSHGICILQVPAKHRQHSTVTTSRTS